MTHLTACILKPRTAFHVGEREGMREGSKRFIHSDTLFSAICHSFRLLYGSSMLSDFLAAEQAPEPALVISSAFPCQRGRFYFPLPRNFIPQDKDTKRIQFVEKSAFEALLAAGVSEESLKHCGLPGNALATEDVPRVSISRLTGTVKEEAGFYHVGLTHCVNETALFFLMRVAETWHAKVRAAIRLMCDEGIGGYRTVGKGSFEQPDWQSITLDTPADPTGVLLLSLYYPADDEATDIALGWYELIQRRGYVFSPDNRSLRRRPVMMFSEGSVFPGAARRGKLVDVTPERAAALGLPHPVYRNGLAFWVPCKGGGNAC